MQDLKIRKIVIVGGGTAGWMTAAGLAKTLKDDEISIRLVESDAIGTVGVGEATIPQIQYYNRFLGFDEDEFIRRTNGTFKLGIEFVDWGRIGDRYLHPFANYGQDMEGIHFHHFWFRYARTGKAPPLDDFNLLTLAARNKKFQRPNEKMVGSPLRTIAYAFHFDAALYARYLRERSEADGVARTEGKVQTVNQHSETGFVQSIILDTGEVIDGDLFIDCTGFRGLLIEETLKTGYEDWSHYLPVNSAIAAPSTITEDPVPFTRATAKKAGWQWRIPLQSRVGNGHVFCKDFMSDDEAMQSFVSSIEGELVRDPHFLRFTTGIRKKPWNKNVVSIGLSLGFLEPLESTSIHLIQSAVSRLMANFPDKAFNEADIEYFNWRTKSEYEQVRDFLILHYHATERNDSPFWNYCRTMEIPDSLRLKLAVYRENARLYRHDVEMFREGSWLAVLHGQNVFPKRYHPIADILPAEELEARMKKIEEIMRACEATMPTHQAFIDHFCKAPASTQRAPVAS